jgi:hypothetical protein
MLEERLSPADEAARDNEMREALGACPRILDLIAAEGLTDVEVEAVTDPSSGLYLRVTTTPDRAETTKRLLQRFPVRIALQS